MPLDRSRATDRLGHAGQAPLTPVDPRYLALRADLTARLRRVVPDMSPAAFDALVADICAMKLRWDPGILERWGR